MNKIPMESSTNTSHAFTRVELLACVVGGGLVLAVILPGLANSSGRSDQAVCFNNLRQIGVAYANVGLETPAGRVPWRVPAAQGGTMDHPLKQNLFLQFSVLSNFLAHPGLLADPADDRRSLNPARNWGTTTGGLWNPNHQNNAISYFLALHGDFQMPRSLLAGDQNLATSGFGACSSGISPASVLERNTARWTNAVHGLTGNLLSFDGAVEQSDSNRLRDVVSLGQNETLGGGPFAMHILVGFQ